MPDLNKKLHISIITLFPDMFKSHLKHLPLSRALSKGLVQIDLVNLRDFAIDKRGTVDSPPYGGGPGMILRPEPIHDAVISALSRFDRKNLEKPKNEDSQSITKTGVFQNDANKNVRIKIVFLTPRGALYSQKAALELSQNYSGLLMVCGRYEGIDQRVIDYFVKESEIGKNTHAEEVSIGNYILSGGEVAAMAIMESVVRLIPGAIDNREALNDESFSQSRAQAVEHPQYTRPRVWKDMKVPEVLLSGHHKNIQTWKRSTV